jgi:hypothetical protein
VSLDQAGAIAARCRIQRDPGAGDASADDQYIYTRGRHALESFGPAGRSKLNHKE